MSALTHDNRQSILNRVYARYMIMGKRLTRSSRSVVSLFDRSGFLDRDWTHPDCRFPTHEFHKRDTDFIDKLRIVPEHASLLFPMDGNDELDNDDFAFLIDLESEYRSAVTHAWDRFDEMKKLDEDSFLDDLNRRLDRLAANEGLDRPASALHAS